MRKVCNHENVIKFISFYEDDQGYYIIMELLDAEKCLQKELKRYKETKFDRRVV